MCRFLPHRRGFSLIEATIVLAIVGLVIGGIWAAASAVNQNLKFTKLIEGVLIGSDKLRRLVWPATVAPSGGWVLIDDICENANIFPTFPRLNGKIQNPYGTQMGAVFAPQTNIGAACYVKDSFVAIILPLPTPALCQKAAAAITSRFKGNAELAEVWTTGADNTTGAIVTAFPISATGSECAGLVAPVQVRLFFKSLAK